VVQNIVKLSFNNFGTDNSFLNVKILIICGTFLGSSLNVSLNIWTEAFKTILFSIFENVTIRKKWYWMDRVLKGALSSKIIKLKIKFTIQYYHFHFSKFFVLLSVGVSAWGFYNSFDILNFIDAIYQRFPSGGSRPGTGPEKQNGGSPKYFWLILNFIIINLNNINR